MKLKQSQAYAIVFVTGLAVLGLTACMQDNRQASVIPTQAAPSNYGLFYMDEGGSVKLAYGAPNSDDVGVMMECVKGSRSVDVSDVARTTAAPVLTLKSAGRTLTLNATPSSGDGVAVLTARAAADAAPLQSFKRSGRLDVVYAGANYKVAATPAEETGVKKFFAACEQQGA